MVFICRQIFIWALIKNGPVLYRAASLTVGLLHPNLIHFAHLCGSFVFYLSQKRIFNLQVFFGIDFCMSDAAIFNIHSLNYKAPSLQRTYTRSLKYSVLCFATQL